MTLMTPSKPNCAPPLQEGDRRLGGYVGAGAALVSAALARSQGPQDRA
jgi:hypothetical protein